MKWTIRLTLISLLLLLAVVYLAGGGHGSYLPAIFLFPWALLSVLWSTDINSPTLWLALVQYPLYGVLIDKSGEVRLNIMAAIIILSHILLAGAIFLNWPDMRY